MKKTGVRYVTILILLFIAFAADVLGQSEKAVMKMPDINDPKYLENHKSNQVSARPISWFVFSDQHNNQAFTDSVSSSVLTNNIGYLEIFYVIDESSERVQLVRARDTRVQAGTTGTLVASTNSAIGWVPKSKLIVVNHCIQKDGSKAPFKAMVINRLLDFMDNADFKKQEIGHFQFYKSPLLDAYDENQTAAKVYKIYYIVKESGGSLLLSKAATINDPNYDKGNILGWINENYTTPWNSRASLQPNYNLSNRPPSKVADSVRIAENWLKGLDGPPNWVEDPISTSPWVGSRDRLPYLGPSENPHVLHVGIIQDISTEEGSNIMDIIIKLREESKKYSNDLNIVFVMDGTSSMREYFRPAVNAINSSLERIQAHPDLKRLKLNWGAAVYRDFAPGSLPLEFIEMTNDATKITTFLNGIQPGMDQGDQTLCEAMYYGLNSALTTIFADNKITPGSTNILIHVGDAGDNLKGLTSRIPENNKTADQLKTSIIDRIAKLDCHILSYQTFHRDLKQTPYPCEDGRRSPGDTTYADFITQMNDIILQGTQKAYRNAFPNDAHKISMKLNSSTNTYTVDYYLKSRVKYMAQCKKMEPENLTQNIVDIVYGASMGADYFSKVLREIIWGNISLDSLAKINPAFKEGSSDFDKIDKVNVLKQIIDMFESTYNRQPTDKELEDIVSGKIQPYLEGYTPLLNWWLFDVLVSDQELQRLIADFGKLAIKDQSGFGQQTNAYTAFADLCGTYIGETQVDCDNVTILELFKKMIDCPTLEFSQQFAVIGDLTIGQIKDQNVFDKTMLQILAIEISKKRDDLIKIELSGYKDYGTDVFENIHYYWIPVSRFPFCN